jgi:holo-[acyl-carrier protein] synthase
MLIGLGTDIVAVARMERFVSRLTPYGASLVFSPHEIARLGRGASFAAGRFAVKEAMLKALRLGFGGGMRRLSEVETREGEHGEPTVVTRGRLRDLLAERGVREVHVSISHEQSHAIAVVILTA